MNNGCAQSEDYIDPADVRFIVQSDHDQRPDRMSTSQPVRDLASALQAATNALNNGATEVRIRRFASPLVWSKP